MFDGVLFFPITPFDPSGEVDLGVLARHIEQRLDAAPGGVFVAGGTGEFHALSVPEVAAVARRAVEVVDGRVPVFAGAGGPLATAVACAAAARDAGVDGVLLLPPYLVNAPKVGLVSYVRAVAAAGAPPIVLYNRANAVLDVPSVVELAQLPGVVGFKDGHGDLELVARIVSAVRAALASSGKPFWFFNGMPTAELTVPAYRGVGVPLYSSAVFAFAPEIATTFYRAVTDGDDTLVSRLLDVFYGPLAALRDRMPGYAVSLVKAGVRATGLDVGSVRAPLVDPSAEDVAELSRIVGAGLELVGTTL